MAEHGEWTRKGATLSDVTAKKEYGVEQDFIIKGINARKLEFREGAIYGNPYFRVLRSQLEVYIASELGDDHLSRLKSRTELRQVKSDIASHNKQLAVLQLRKKELEMRLAKLDEKG